MQWNKDTLRETRLKVGLSQTALAEALGVHFRTVQNCEKGITNNPSTALPALDKVLGTTGEVVSIDEYNKVVEALNSATELNRKLTNIIQSSIQSSNTKEKI